MDHSSTSKAGGKLESLPKDELLKLIKKQALGSKDLKKKVADLESNLQREISEVTRLENEKKAWISRGVSAEFEKKDKLVKKDKELEIAAQLGKEMLEENDELRTEIEEMKKEFEDAIMQNDDVVDKLSEEKRELDVTLRTLQEEYKTVVLETQDMKEKLSAFETERNNFQRFEVENKNLQGKIKELEQAVANPSKLHKLKEEYGELAKENKTYKDKQRKLKDNKVTIESLKSSNEELTEAVNVSESKVKALGEDLQKANNEKEKFIKTIKSMKTKFERFSLMEDELRKQLNVISGERDELLKKNLKINQKQKAKENTDSSKKAEIIEDLKKQILSLESETANLKEIISNHDAKSEEMLSKYENAQKDVENLQFEMEEINAIKTEQSEEKLKLQSEKEGLEVQLKDLQESVDEMKVENDDLAVAKAAQIAEKENIILEKEALVAKIQDLQTDFDSLNCELNELAACKHAQEEENEKLCIENKSLLAENESFTSRIEILAANLEKFKEEREFDDQEKEKVQQQISAAKEKLEKALTENVELKHEFQKLEEEVDMFRKGAPETKATILKLEGRVDELLNQLQTLNEEKLNQETALEELFKSYDDLSNKYDFECKEREKKEKEITQLEERLAQLDAEIKEGKEKSTIDLEQQIVMLEETIKELSSSKDNYQQELEVKEQCIIQLRNDMEEVGRRNANLGNKEIENIALELENVKMQLIAAQKELEINISEKELLQSQLEETVFERDSSLQSLSMFEEKLAQIQASLDVKTLECDDLKQQIVEHSTPDSSCTDIPAQQEEILSLQKDLEQLDVQYRNVASENLALKEEFQCLLNNKAACESEVDEMKIKCDRCEKESAFLKDELMLFHELSSKYGYDNVDDLDVFICSLNSDFSDSTKMLHNVTVEKEEVEMKCVELESDLKNQCLSIQEKDDKIALIENELHNLQNDLNVFTDKNVDSLAQKDIEIEQLRNCIDNLEECIENKNALLTQSDGEVGKTVVDDTELLKEELAQHKDEMSKLRDALNHSHLEMMTMKTSEENRSNELLEKQLQIDALKEEIDTLTHSLSLEREKCEQSEVLCKDMENELSEKENSASQISKELEESQLVAEELRALINQTNDSLNDLMKKYEEVLDKNNCLEQDNMQIMEGYKLLESKKVSLEDDKIEREEELEKLKVTHSNVEDELQSALDKVEELENVIKEKLQALDGMDVLLKEKGEKGSKFRTAAIKARKELETLRTKFHGETNTFEQQMVAMKEEILFLENELLRQKTECSKHEDEFEELQNELKELQTQLHAEKEMSQSLQQQKEEMVSKIETMTLKVCQYENDTEELRKKADISENLATVTTNELIKMKELLQCGDEAVKNKDAELAKLKEELDSLQKQSDDAMKHTEQMSLMNLEISDYVRTVNNLQARLEAKEKQCSESERCIEKMTVIQKTLENDTLTLKKESSDIEEKNQKLKAVIVKLKKDVSEKQKQHEGNLTTITERDFIIEELRKSNEEVKLGMAKLNNEKTNLQKEMKTSIDVQEKKYQTLEVKFARVNSDLLTIQRENQSLHQEFEQYKVRAHNVLKQQKSRQTDEEKEGEREQIAQLEEMIRQLKQRLHESNENLRELEATHNELETEYEGLQTRHHQFIEEIGEKELTWKQRLTQVKLEASSKVLEYQDKLQLLQNENERLKLDSREQSDVKSEEKEEYLKEIHTLKEELARLKKPRIEIPPQFLEIRKQDSVDSKNESNDADFKSVSERQEGEGMDSRELEIIDTLSQRSSNPHTPLSPTNNVSFLEKILSPTEVPFVSSPKSPGSLREELLISKSALTTSLKKNEHMTALIRESEANACRLADQAKVLKEEIRRLERNVERDEALSNLEYLKNVIIKFLKVGTVEKEQLVPVLSTMLKLSDDEKKFVCEYAKGESGDSIDDNGSWSSYVYRWTSLS